MKVRRLMFFMVLILLVAFITGCGSNMMEFAADDSSSEACLYEVSDNLNNSEWQAVLDSSCASHMQKGAAYFGAAGYDIADIIARMSEANDSTNDTDTYLNNLVGIVTRSTLDNLNNAFAQYGLVLSGQAGYDDARFYRDVFIGPIRGLANIRSILDSDGNGINSSCDINGNGTADEADVLSCALNTVASVPCGSGVSVTSTVPGLSFTGYAGTYTGLVIQVTGTADPDCASDTYYKLLNSSPQYVAVTTSDDCTIGANPWKCPYVQDGAAVDAVVAFDSALSSADSSISLLVGTGDSEVDDAIESLRMDACGGDTCTSEEIAAYLQTL